MRFLRLCLVAGLLGACAGPAKQLTTPTVDPVELPPEPPAPPPEPEPPAPVDPPRVALVLGGGGARGFAHVGILRVLEQEKIPVDLVIGTSVGSLIGAMYAANPDTFQLEWTAFQIEKDDLFDFSIFSAATGPVKGEAIREFVAEKIETKNIEDLKVPFVAVAADLHTGERVEFDRGSVVDAVRASVSIPGVFTPAKIGERILVDGGVVANLATRVARSRGADIVLAANISEDVNVDDPEDVDDVVSIILQSINIMMGEMAQHEIEAADVVMSPAIGDVGTMDFSQKKRCMEEGIRAAKDAVPAIKRAVAQYYIDRGGEPPPQFVVPPETTASTSTPSQP